MSAQETYGRRAARSFAWNHFYKLSEFGLLNVFTMIIARHFGPVGSTPYVVYAAAGVALSLLGAFAVDGILLRYLPRISEAGELTEETTLPGAHDLNSFVRKLFAFRMFVVLCIISLLLLSVALLTNVFGTSETFDSLRSIAPILCVFLLAQAVIAFSTFALLGLLRTKTVFLCSIIARGSLVVVTLALVFFSDIAIREIILLHVSSAIVNAALLLVSIRHILKPLSAAQELSLADSIRGFFREIYGFLRRPSTIKTMLLSPVMVYGLTTWGSDLIGIALGRQSDILLLRALWGDQTPEVGYYNVASLVVLLTEYIFLLGFGGALISVFSKLAQDDERDSPQGQKINYARLRRGGAEIVGFQHVSLVPLCAFVYMFSLTIVRAIYGYQYDVSAALVQHAMIAVAINIVIFNGGLPITALMAIGKQRITLTNRLCWGIVSVIVNYFLIREYGALGAILGTNWVNALACGVEWSFARKFIGLGSNVVSSVKVCLISAAAAVGVHHLMQRIDLRQGPIVELLIAGPLFFGVVFGLFFLFRLPEKDVVITRLKKAFA